MRWIFEKSSIVSAAPTLTVICCLCVMFPTIGGSNQVTDTCGHYFFLPMFPECDLYLEAIPCFNDTPNIIVTLATPAGEVVHSFHVTFSAMTELSLYAVNKDKYPGLVVRSNEDISLYIHKSKGDSMIVFPIDAYARDYETPRLTPLKNSTGGISRNSDNRYLNGALYIFSPFNNTSITIMQLHESVDPTSHLSSSPSSSSTSQTFSSAFSSRTIKLDAFEIYEQQIDTSIRYRLRSADVFAVVLVQTSNMFAENDSLCSKGKLSLLDFIPPYLSRGKYFYLAFPNFTDFKVFILGLENTSFDLTTDLTSREIFLGPSGNNIADVYRTASAWMSASHPVSIYITLTLCTNTSSSTQTKMCAKNGFFLPSVEHYFTCEGNLSHNGCLCRCPSVFQMEISPHNLHFFKNASESLPTTIYPLLVGELFDVSTSIVSSTEFKDVDDIIVTTNNSFLIFRHDMANLNFLPGGTTLLNIYNLCTPDSLNSLFYNCAEKDSSEGKSKNSNNKHKTEGSLDINPCSCKFFQESSLFSIMNQDTDVKYRDRPPYGTVKGGSGGGNEYVWVEEDEDTARPLIAVVVSLCVSIFAVIALISGYMLVEMMSRRKHVRNTKIRPFVS